MFRFACFILFIPALVLLTSCMGWFESGPEPLTPPFTETVPAQSVKFGVGPVKDTDAVNMMITALTMTLVSRGEGAISFAITGESNAKKLAFRVMQKMVDQKLADYAVSEPQYIVGSFVNEDLEVDIAHSQGEFRSTPLFKNDPASEERELRQEDTSRRSAVKVSQASG